MEEGGGWCGRWAVGGLIRVDFRYVRYIIIRCRKE